MFEKLPKQLPKKLPKQLPKQLPKKLPKQMFEKLPIAYAEVQAGNIFEHFLYEIRQTIFSLYWTKKNTKKVYNNIMNSI